MKCPGALVTTALLIAAVATAAPAPKPAAAPKPAMASAAGGSALSRPLPPDVLARIFTNHGATDITRSDFVKLVRELGGSMDALTPAMRNQVLELLVERRTLASEAARSGRHWTGSDSLEYTTFADQVTLKAALDSALTEFGFALANAGRPVEDAQTLGVLLRDTSVTTLSPEFDAGTLQTLAGAFAALPQPNAGMSVQEQLHLAALVPAIPAADSARVVVRSRFGTYTAGQLLADYARLDPRYRPPVRTSEQVKDLANSTLYERLLREHAQQQGLARKPALAAAIADHAEMLDVQRWVTRNAYDKVPLDTLSLRRHFKAHPERFVAWGRADIVRLTVDTRAQADSLALRLRVAGEAESLAAQSQRAGVPYRATLVESADSTLFARLRRAGAGAVVGPDSLADGWRVLRVLGLTPRRPLRFDEAYDAVKADWYQSEGERRAQEVVAALRSHTLVNVNDAALARLGRASGPAPAKRSPR